MGAHQLQEDIRQGLQLVQAPQYQQIAHQAVLADQIRLLLEEFQVAIVALPETILDHRQAHRLLDLLVLEEVAIADQLLARHLVHQADLQAVILPEDLLQLDLTRQEDLLQLVAVDLQEEDTALEDLVEEEVVNNVAPTT